MELASFNRRQDGQEQGKCCVIKKNFGRILSDADGAVYHTPSESHQAFGGNDTLGGPGHRPCWVLHNWR